MANKFPLVINNSSTLVGELIQGDSINLELSGIFDGNTNGSLGDVLTSTGGAGVEWKRAAEVYLNDAQTLLNKEFLSCTFDASSNILSNVANSSLSNSAITVNGNSVPLGGTVDTPNDNDNTTYGISFQDGGAPAQKALRLTAGGTGTGFQDNFLQTDTDPNNRLTITRIGTDTLEFSALIQDLTLDTHLSYDADTVYDGSTARQIQTDATPGNLGGTIVSRNGFGDFAANVITADLTGNVTGNVSGSAGSVEQPLTLSSFLSFTDSGTEYNGSVAREIQTNGTSSNSPNTLVARDGSGSFTSNQINATVFVGPLTGDVTGNADTATTADKVEFTLTRGLYLTGSNYNGSAATTWSVDASISNTANKVVVRDGNGSFSANVINATEFIGNGITPVGGIILWSGATNNIPSGWALCNGANGTPNLRNRFVVGAGDTYNPADTGGFTNIPVISHSHNTTQNSHRHNISDPGHNHNTNVGGHKHTTIGHGNEDDGGSRLTGSNNGGSSNNSMNNDAPNVNLSNNGVGINRTQFQNVSINVDSEGNSGTGRNLPPYYALAYIMRTV